MPEQGGSQVKDRTVLASFTGLCLGPTPRDGGGLPIIGAAIGQAVGGMRPCSDGQVVRAFFRARRITSLTRASAGGNEGLITP